MQHGDFTHIEIPADDTERAKRFYGDLFGWSFAPEVPGFEGYHVFTTPVGEAGTAGAIGKRGQMAPEKLRAYVNVDSIDETLSRVADLGGTVVDPKAEVPGMGWFAVLTDSEGNQIGLWEQTPEQQGA
ncbi:MAG: VOC family protein [Chloroflexi bacterium]|nr:VOC family protein [Chloroflexota bacterium]